MKITTQTSQYEIYVARPIGSTHNHVLVKLTLLHDRTDLPFIKTAFLQQASTLLAQKRCLPDKSEVVLSMTDILLWMLEQQGL